MSEQVERMHRRTKSVTRAEEIQAEEQKARKNQPDKPCHKPRDSLFSWNSGFDNFTGFVNWAFLLLSIGGIRLLLENFIKYGIRIDPIQWLYILTGQDDSGSEHPSIVLIMYSCVPVMLCLLTEKGLAVEIIPNHVGMFVHVVNLIALNLLPMAVIHVKDGFSLVGASTVTTLYSILFLKLWSYVQVNMWCRLARLNNKSSLRRQSMSYNNLRKRKNSDGREDSLEDLKLVQYPDNLNLKDIYYFLLAPTLCYELNFPKTERIRKRFLIKRIIEVVLGTQLIFCVIQQYMIPSVKNSLIPFSNMDYTKATERLLKLAIPNHLAWLCMFYIMFHSWLNLLGEILHFADRSFYGDWWNCNNIDSFWRNWNLPVHRWALRHLYFPLIEMGYGKSLASLAVFFISAFFHEYMVSVPLKTYKIWAFMGMMAQVPLSHFSKAIEKAYGPRFGNLVFWASIILGQPLCIMMYYHDYIVVRYGESLLEDYSHI
ncbi:diacylglycerol O-acyltransferase 1 [Diorhabda carinulata]|uniref:diacylglycerol O-acyltransferase 1 n=1 Tax=Diorhabda sublineata TaxID=1163346 RepID=UPI0024E097A5|nr:diacylglycerol O-acyltransferase 1 [Diorhabda sublineata]XP_056630076.1 diacylglycerol O-acyltransferase 1 [Diorhabda sublineata]XP_056630077.1 diacylglycerol O-acyltransferase 1 [Diorhabda sublineata]XP_057651409.1 diacylglycerol O-acyltransferase 1 [Diorhabda carinulata]